MKNEAFSIVELVVTIGMVILLSGLVVTIASYVQTKGKRSQTEVTMVAIENALENYKLDNGIYPSNAESRSLNPGLISPVDYQRSCSFLYSQLTGDDDADPVTPLPPNAKNYFGTSLKPSMLAPNPAGPNTYLNDAFSNSYGYSTAKAADLNGVIGNNPTFDLWSTAGSVDPAQWIRNW